MVPLRYCPNCENLLIPKNKKLYCKVCNQDFELNSVDINGYKLLKHIKHERISPTIIKDGFKLWRFIGNTTSESE